MSLWKNILWANLAVFGLAILYFAMAGIIALPCIIGEEWLFIFTIPFALFCFAVSVAVLFWFFLERI